MEVQDTKRIAALNDLCRTAMGITGRLVQTPGICGLPLGDQPVRQSMGTDPDPLEGDGANIEKPDGE